MTLVKIIPEHSPRCLGQSVAPSGVGDCGMGDSMLEYMNNNPTKFFYKLKFCIRCCWTKNI